MAHWRYSSRSDTKAATERLHLPGSIPERDDRDDGKLYNTATVYNPNGQSVAPIATRRTTQNGLGELIAIHRKVHLFDIEIPGKITFKVSAKRHEGHNLRLRS